MLAGHAEARRLWFLRNDIDLGLTALAESSRPGLVEDHALNDALASKTATQRPFGATYPRWVAAAAIAATLGAAVGVFGTSAVWAIATPWRSGAGEIIEVLNESFEHSVSATIPGLPRGLSDASGGTWHGDEARVVAAMQGVEPSAGARMLRFERSTYQGEGTPKHSAWGDIYKLIDVEPFLAISAGGAVTARLSATFLTAADAITAEERYSASVRICAFDRECFGDVAAPPTLTGLLDKSIALGARKTSLDQAGGGPAPLSVDVAIPASTKYILLHISAVRDAPPPSAEPVRFPGHFLDDVRLDLVMRPSR